MRRGRKKLKGLFSGKRGKKVWIEAARERERNRMREARSGLIYFISAGNSCFRPFRSKTGRKKAKRRDISDCSQKRKWPDNASNKDGA